MDWPTYQGWLEHSLSDFRKQASASSHALFVHDLPGDTIRIDFSVQPSPKGTHVHVTFTAYPS